MSIIKDADGKTCNQFVEDIFLSPHTQSQQSAPQSDSSGKIGDREEKVGATGGREAETGAREEGAGAEEDNAYRSIHKLPEDFPVMFFGKAADAPKGKLRGRELDGCPG